MSGRGPREGVYLDAALAVIEQQVDERIDGLERRRRRNLRVGVAALAFVAAGASAATAAALSSPPPATVVVEVPVEVVRLHCVEGADPGAAAFFTVRYAVPATIPDPVDAVAACVDARRVFAEDWRELSPEQLLGQATDFLRGHLLDARMDALPIVQHVSIGSAGPEIAGLADIAGVECGASQGSSRVVLVAAGSPPDACDVGGVDG